ncbi:redoxin family protein [Actinomycetospora rhizophila]|uniref:Redoxin family protein n=1 Tax=Actinomycetospora rhizophila TaxID=1416876 RepID=A0ABV9ZEN5_9PSEU
MGLVEGRRPVDLPVESRLPDLGRAAGWLNSPPLDAADLRGEVVLVEFWTYTCINWLRTLGHVRAWAREYRDQGLVVIGVHTPEFPFEADADNVRRAVERLGVDHPVALDPGRTLWEAFGNRYWPAFYLADVDGRVRHHRFGEDHLDETEDAIRHLLRDAGRHPAGDERVPVAPIGIEAPADWAHLGSPETYLGWARGERFASPGGAALDRSRTYVEPEHLRLHEWAFVGEWVVARRASVLTGATGTLIVRFHARDLHLVMAPRGAPVPFRVLLDGRAPGDAHGLDVDAAGHGTLAEPRLHHLIRAPGAVEDRVLEITFLAPGAETYVLTFG